ncbi:hypothetical protein ACF0H5_010354 [Mactra antiquata]
MSTAVVIGGGISGLSSAYYLQKTSHFSKILVLESSNRLGGWMKTVTTPQSAKLEMGPRSVRPVGLAGLNTLLLSEELGLSDEVVPVLRSSPAASDRYIYANGKMNALPKKPLSLLTKKPPFSRPLFRYFLNDYVARKRPGDAPDESAYDFFSRRFDEDFAKYALDPLCRGIFAGDCRQLSLKSCFPMLHDAELRSRSVIIGMLKNRTKVKPIRKCQLFERKQAEKWASFSFRNGLQQLPYTLSEVLKQNPNVEISKHSSCSDLEFNDDGAKLTVNGESVQADHVVSSIYSADLASILADKHEDLRSFLKNIPAVDTVVACFEFDEEIKMRPGFGHLTPSFVNSCVLGVIYDSCTFPEHDRPDKKSTRFTVMMGGSWFDDLKKAVPSMSNKDLGHFALDALKTQLGITAKPSNVCVEHLPNCIPQYVLGHDNVLKNLSSIIEKQKLPLSLVGSSYKGPSVNDCINNARLEMERVVGKPLQ